MPHPQGRHGGLQEGARVKKACTRGYPGDPGGSLQGRALQADVGRDPVAKEIQEIKRTWLPKSDDKNKENKENDKNKDKDEKGKKGGKKKRVNEVDAEESTPTTTTTGAP